MKVKRIKKWGIYFCAITVFVLFYGCEKDDGIKIHKVGEKPGVVTNVKMTPISGGAIIEYDLPLSEDLRYVKASYTLDNGTPMETKASIYKNKLTVEGFGKEGTYSVTLTSVSVGEVESDPLETKVEVLRPPHLLVLDRLSESDNVIATFGGINMTYTNETGANLVIRIIKIDSTGQWIPVQSEYTNADSGIIRVRGQEAKETVFGIYIEDRYDHFSDTLQLTRTPILEVPIPTPWARLDLPNDAAVRASGFPFTGIWDGNTNAGYLSTAPNIELPNSITIDLKIPVRLSRMQIWATRYSNINDVYGPAHLYDFEIFASNAPNPTGEWDDTWVSLGRFVSSRPLTGYGFGTPATAAEQAEIRDNGETYEFPDPMAFEKFRFIRFKNYATWNGSYEGGVNFFIYELRLFGQL